MRRIWRNLDALLRALSVNTVGSFLHSVFDVQVCQAQLQASSSTEGRSAL